MSKHHMYGTRINRIWQRMKTRCNNSKNEHYNNYGARGIKVCEEWENDFLSFYNWAMENGYKDNLTIDRIDVNGNYEPNNCRWITNYEQQSNKRNNRKIEYQGKKYTISQLSRLLGIEKSTLRWRIIHNWKENELSLPPDTTNKYKRNKKENKI